MIIDDPLSSYDIKKQYEIVFDIFSRLVEKGKKVIVLTHNINFVNIVNSQYPNKFNYYFLDCINGKITTFKICIKTDGSILNIEDLVNNIDDSSSEKKWIGLIIEKDLVWGKTEERHKLFHYDDEYIDSTTGYTNTELVKLIDSFTEIKKDYSDDFDSNIDNLLIFLNITITTYNTYYIKYLQV